MTLRRLFPLALPVALAVGACGPGDPGALSGTRLAITAAASVRPAMEELVAEYGRSHPGIAVETTYGASGNLSSQLVNGAPFDLFYAADTRYPRRLAEQGVALRGSERVYAVGRLVLIVRHDRGVDDVRDGLGCLSDARIRRIAIANPDVAPYGLAARECLDAAGLGPVVSTKLVLGESVEQAAQFLHIGAADAALLPEGVASRPELREVGAAWPVPAEAARPIEHGMIILGRTARPEAARAFDAFVASAAGRAILVRHGLGVPEE